MTILGFPVPSYSKISDPNIPSFIKDNILWFYISVNDVALMQVVKSFDKASH